MKRHWLRSNAGALFAGVGVVLLASLGYRFRVYLPTTVALCLIAVALLLRGTRTSREPVSSELEEAARIEARARQIQRELSTAVDMIPAQVWSTLPDGTVDYVNRHWLEYTGRSLEDVVPGGWVNVLHPDDRAALLELRRTALARGEPYEAETRVRRADGQYRWHIRRVVPLRDRRGQLVRWYGIGTDIEDLKQAEAKLAESERRYRNIFLSAGVSIWEEDYSEVRAAIDALKAEGVTDVPEYLEAHPEFVRRAVSLVKLIDVNSTTLTLFEARSKDEVLASLERVFLPETEQAFAAVLVALAEGRTSFEAETVVRTLQGHRRDVLFTIVFPRDTASFRSVLVTLIDITERRRLDTELRRSQAYLIASQEVGNTGSWARRISTGKIYWSDEVFRIFGLDPATTVPSRAAATRLWHPDDRERADRTIDDAGREKRGYAMDLRIVRPDGSLRYVHIRGQPVFDPSGETDEYIGVVMDITHRKRTERALRRARERALEARFAAVLEERTRLARDIHDTLLQGFTGISLKLLATVHRVSGPPESVTALKDLVGLAQQTLTDARRAVWDLRSPALAAGDLPTAVRTTAEDTVRGTALELTYEVSGSQRPVDAEVEAVVVRVAQEAVTNVIKHAEARTVLIRLSFEARLVRLSVSDDGRGFAVASDFESYGGHWGLLGMRERTSQIGGRLSLRSNPGRGTEVELLAPYAVRDRSPHSGLASSSMS
jgi:PAS domain S-box-containing protein